MNRLITSIFCILFTGCATVGPMQRRAEQIRIPVVDFRDAEVADLIVFLVEHVNRPSPPRVSISLIQERDPAEEERKKQQFADLYRLCEGMKISLNARYCSLLDLLTFVASCAELDAEFRNDELVIATKDGKVIMK